MVTLPTMARRIMTDAPEPVSPVVSSKMQQAKERQDQVSPTD
jgi:hypothetical protein